MKEPREPRVKFFAFYPDDFFEDERVLQLSNKDKAAWLMLIAKMFRYKGIIPDSPELVASLIGTTRNDAIRLRSRLLTLRLLGYDGQLLVSKRLQTEYGNARKAYQQRIDAGIRSAEKRKQQAENVIDFPNARCNDRSNDEPTE